MANKVVSYRNKFVFNYPKEDSKKIENIVEKAKSLIAIDYQETLDKLNEEQKTEGFKLLQEHAKENFGIDLKLKV